MEADYYTDSLEKIAGKLKDHSPRWKFLGDIGYTYDIPSMKVEGFDEHGFVALPDYSDDVMYDLAVVDNVTTRYIQVDRYIPFDKNSQTDIIIYNNWYIDFIPVNIFAFINGTSLADLGFSGQVLKNLRRKCMDSPNGWMEWHEINMEWAARYVEEPSRNMLYIYMRTLRGQQQFTLTEGNGLIHTVEYALLRE